MDIKKLAGLAMLSLEHGNLANGTDIVKELEDLIESVRLPQDLTYTYELKEEDSMQFRDDIVKPSLPFEEVLKNAPQKQAGCFVVPKTVREE